MVTTLVLAHRGSPDPDGGVAENTVAAFERARRLGADGVELDVRLTADGALVVHHDPVIGDGPVISEAAAADLPPFVPGLGEVLDACTGMVVNLELKNLPGEPGFDPDERLSQLVADVVGARGLRSSVVISSFWPAALDAVTAADPAVRTGLLVGAWFEAAGCVPAALAHRCAALHPQIGLVSQTLVAEAHQAELAVAAWTVNGRDELRAAVDAGVDTVITDDVVAATEVVRHA